MVFNLFRFIFKMFIRLIKKTYEYNEYTDNKTERIKKTHKKV